MHAEVMTTMPPEIFMREAIALATAALRSERGGPFGCVIVRRGEVVARAEVTAIRAACRQLGRFALPDCELYTSCEPCPMCLAAIYWARIPRIYYANTRADAAAIGFDDDWIYQQMPLPPEQRAIEMTPLLRPEAQAAFVEWRDKPDKIAY